MDILESVGSSWYGIECLEIYEAYLNLYFIRSTICSTPPGYHPIPSTYSSTVLHPIPSTFIQNMVPLSVGVKLYAPVFELADTTLTKNGIWQIPVACMLRGEGSSHSAGAISLSGPSPVGAPAVLPSSPSRVEKYHGYICAQKNFQIRPFYWV